MGGGGILALQLQIVEFLFKLKRRNRFYWTQKYFFIAEWGKVGQNTIQVVVDGDISHNCPTL